MSNLTPDPVETYSGLRVGDRVRNRPDLVREVKDPGSRRALRRLHGTVEKLHNASLVHVRWDRGGTELRRASHLEKVPSKKPKAADEARVSIDLTQNDIAHVLSALDLSLQDLRERRDSDPGNQGLADALLERTQGLRDRFAALVEPQPQ